MTKKHSGIMRTYLPPFSLSVNIPSIQEIDSKSDLGYLFVNHITQNHKGLNWKIYRYKLNSNNYKSFIYAFALTAINLNPTSNTSWQFVSNAKRLSKAIQKNHIILSNTEEKLIKNCIDFQINKEIKRFRIQKYDEIITELKNEYLG